MCIYVFNVKVLKLKVLNMKTMLELVKSFLPPNYLTNQNIYMTTQKGKELFYNSNPSQY